MKSTKNFLSFTSVLAILGFILLMLFFTPCFNVTNYNETIGQISLFNITFGRYIAISGVASNFGVQATPGVICAFIFAIIGIVLALAKNRFKLFGFLTFGFYTASGILVLLSRNMAYYASKNAVSGPALGTAGDIFQTGWIYAIGSLLIIIGAFALFDVIANLSRPKQKEVY